MTEDRLIQIETKLAFQEQVVTTLNEAVCEQQKRIDKLVATCQGLANRLQSLNDALPATDPLDEKPPHY